MRHEFLEQWTPASGVGSPEGISFKGGARTFHAKAEARIASAFRACVFEATLENWPNCRLG
jgi:hypothetical protein